MSAQRIRVVMTAGVHEWSELEAERQAWLARCPRRHVAGDWGDVDTHDWAVNDAAVRHGCGRLLSAYQPTSLRRAPIERCWS
jgi:hypothetical protein